MRWLNEHNIKMAVAGRSEFSDNEQTARMAYEELFRLHNFKIDAFNPSETVLFPELEENAEVPEITESCWNILNKSPNDLMCSNSRMGVKRKRASLPSVVACTLLPYDLEFDLGTDLKKAEEYGDELRDTLRKHNLTHLANKKPGMIEKRMQDATDKLWDDLESVTGDNTTN